MFIYPPFTHSLPPSLPPSLPHFLPPSLTSSLTHSLPHFLLPSPPSLPPSLHSLTHSLTSSLPPSLTLTPSLSLPHSQRLREEVPELEDNQRAPKVTILRKAMDFIRRMQERDRKAEEELVSERRRKARLLERLNQLRVGRI